MIANTWGTGIGYAGLLSLNIDLCTTVSRPTNGRLDCASGWDGFGFPFHGKVFVLMPDTGFFKIPLPPDAPAGRRKLDVQWKLLDAAMEWAALLRTRKIRIFTFMLEGGEKPSAKSYGRIDELLREAARRARPGQFLLAVEDIGGGHVSNAAESAELLKRVKDDNVGLTWDPNNAAESGEQPFPGGYRRLDPRAYLSRPSSRLPPRSCRKSGMDRCRPG